MIAYAQGTGGGHITSALQFVDKINKAILFPLITLLLGVAILMFLWGIFQMVAQAGNAEMRSQGKKHILYGIIGIVIMLSAFTILRIATNTFDVPESGAGGGWGRYHQIQQ